MAAERAEGLDIVNVDGKLVIWGAVSRAIRMGPAGKGSGRGVYYIVDLGTGEVGSEGDIEGQVDGAAGGGGGREGGSSERAFDGGRGNGHGLVVVRPGHAKAHRRRHLLPPMPGLAREIGDLVHGEGDGEARCLEEREQQRG